MIEIFVVSFISIALLWGEHYTPWKRWLKRELSRVEAYILGTLAIVLPVLGLYGVWAQHRPAGNPFAWAMIALGVDVMASGSVVIFLYIVDHATDKGEEAEVRQEEVRILRDKEE